MRRDAQLIFGDAIDIGSTSAGSSAVSTNTVDIAQVTDHLGSSQNDRVNVSDRLHWNVQVENAANSGEAVAGSGGTSVITVALRNHTAAITASTLASSDTVDSFTISADASGANYPLASQIGSRVIPKGTYKRFWAVSFAAATKAIATGKVTAWIGIAPLQQGGEHGAL